MTTVWLTVRHRETAEECKKYKLKSYFSIIRAKSMCVSQWKLLTTQSLYWERNLSLNSNLTHSCVLVVVLTWLLCDAYEWSCTTVCILLCSDSLLCASEPLWSSVDVYLCACGHISCHTQGDTQTHTDTYNVNYSPCQFGCNNEGKWSKYIVPGSDILDIISAESIFSHIQKHKTFRF